MKKTILQPLTVLGTVILSGGLWACHSDTKAGAPAAGAMPNVQANLQGYIVKPTAISEKITVSGTLIPAEETTLFSEVSGRVVKLHLPEGQTVKKGTLLVKIFDGDLVAQLHKLQTQLKIAENTLKRQQELLAINGVSQQDFDTAELQVSNIKADMELIRVQISKTEIRAPFTGEIGLRNISDGAYLTPATAIATIRQTSPLKLDFSVPEKYSHLLKTGQKLNFKVAAIADTFSAKVLASEDNINADTRNLKLRAVVQENDKRLVSGTFVEIGLTVDANNNALVVPTQAIIPQARDKKVIVVKNGKAEMRVVKTGVRQPQMVEILDGVAAGDTVATTGIMFIKPDMQLKFNKVQ